MMPDDGGMTRTRPDAEQRAETLKERVYVTFTALAVVLALLSDPAHTTVGTAARTLTLTVVGTALAVLVADVVAHVTVHAALPTASETRHMVIVSAGALSVLVLPLLLLAGSALGLLGLGTALRSSSALLVLSLVGTGFLAVRRLRLPLGQRLLVLLAEAALGLAVIGIEVAVH